MSAILGHVRHSLNHAKTQAQGRAQEWAERHGVEMKYVDVTFVFIGASGIPKMDIVGTADPYIIATLDNNLKFVSTVQVNTLTPVWNEQWKVKNVPSIANLHIVVMDKDDGAITDDIVGGFETTVTTGAKEFTLESPSLRRNRGTLFMKIDTTPSTDADAAARPYIFDGPIRFSRHSSPTVGRLTNLDDARLYSTWKMFLRGVRLFFSDGEKQHWNVNYHAAKAIFQGPTSIAIRSTIQAGHRMLYARTTSNGFGVINDAKDVMTLLHGGKPGSPTAHRVKPAVYTYIIAADDDSFRFSETGAAFFVDFASKHALHANCAEYVRYSGEFHPRPAGGWASFSDDTPDDAVAWELVIDNNSGTYSPSPLLLPNLKDLFEYNFPGFTICTYDFNDPRLAESREACRTYALYKRDVRQEELQPHTRGEEPLAHNASAEACNTASAGHLESTGRIA